MKHLPRSVWPGNRFVCPAHHPAGLCFTEWPTLDRVSKSPSGIHISVLVCNCPVDRDVHLPWKHITEQWSVSSPHYVSLLGRSQWMTQTWNFMGTHRQDRVIPSISSEWSRQTPYWWLNAFTNTSGIIKIERGKETNHGGNDHTTHPIIIKKSFCLRLWEAYAGEYSPGPHLTSVGLSLYATKWASWLVMPISSGPVPTQCWRLVQVFFPPICAVKSIHFPKSLMVIRSSSKATFPEGQDSHTP